MELILRAVLDFLYRHSPLKRWFDARDAALEAAGNSDRAWRDSSYWIPPWNAILTIAVGVLLLWSYLIVEDSPIILTFSLFLLVGGLPLLLRADRIRVRRGVLHYYAYGRLKWKLQLQHVDCLWYRSDVDWSIATLKGEHGERTVLVGDFAKATKLRTLLMRLVRSNDYPQLAPLIERLKSSDELRRRVEAHMAAEAQASTVASPAVSESASP